MLLGPLLLLAGTSDIRDIRVLLLLSLMSQVFEQKFKNPIFARFRIYISVFVKLFAVFLDVKFRLCQSEDCEGKKEI